MTSQVLLFEDPERFVVGTVGLPGERTFFIQVEKGSRLISVALEKTQVQALSERLIYILREIKQVNPATLQGFEKLDDRPLSTPIEEEFRVGAIGLAFDSESLKVQLDFQAVSENQEEDPEFIDVDDLTNDQDILRVIITPLQASTFAKRAAVVVGAGRLPCPFCGGPIDARGHLCPRANGYRR